MSAGGSPTGGGASASSSGGQSGGRVATGGAGNGGTIATGGTSAGGFAGGAQVAGRVGAGGSRSGICLVTTDDVSCTAAFISGPSTASTMMVYTADCLTWCCNQEAVVTGIRGTERRWNCPWDSGQ